MTAETALVLPSLVGLGFALALLVVVAADQVRCSDAAWEAARGLARGESARQVRDVALRLAPDGASLSTGTAGGVADARVSVRLAFTGTLLPAVSVDGRASAACETGVSCGGPASPVGGG